MGKDAVAEEIVDEEMTSTFPKNWNRGSCAVWSNLCVQFCISIVEFAGHIQTKKRCKKRIHTLTSG